MMECPSPDFLGVTMCTGLKEMQVVVRVGICSKFSEVEFISVIHDLCASFR
jgi:hypothetical protein